MRKIADAGDPTINCDVATMQSPRSFVRLAAWVHLPDGRSEFLDTCDETGLVLFLRESLRSLIGNSVNLQDFFLTGPPWQYRRPEYCCQELTTPLAPLQLPDVRVVRDLVALYKNSPKHRLFPVIDLSLFNDTLKFAYEASCKSLRGHASARACVLAFLTLPGIWDLTTPSLALDGKEIVLQLEQLLPQVLREETIEGLQALLMLVCNPC